MPFLDIGFGNFNVFRMKQCAYPGCGAEFEPTGSRSLYCDTCFPKAKKDRKHRVYMTKRYGSPDQWPTRDRRLKDEADAPHCETCHAPFSARRSDQTHCPECAREIALEKARRRKAERTLPGEHVESILALQKAKRELADQIRLQRLAMYEAHEARKMQSAVSTRPRVNIGG